MAQIDKNKISQIGVIHQLQFVFRVGYAHAESVQRRCSVWFDAKFKTRLQTLLQRLEHDAQGISDYEQMDCLRVNLGDVSLDKLESVLDTRLWEKLEHSIKTYRHKRQCLDAQADGKVVFLEDLIGSRIKGGSPSMRAQAQSNRDNGALLSRPLFKRSSAAASAIRKEGDELIRCTDERSEPDAMASFILFLQTGFLSAPDQWCAPSSPQLWLERQLAKPIEAHWRAQVARNCLQPQGLRRLCETFTSPALQALSQWLQVPSPYYPLPKRSNWGVYLPLSALLFLKRYPEYAQEAEPIADAFTSCLCALAEPIGPEFENWVTELLNPPVLPAIRAGLLAVCAAPPVCDALVSERPTPTFAHLREQIRSLNLGFHRTVLIGLNPEQSDTLDNDLSIPTRSVQLGTRPPRRYLPELEIKMLEGESLAVSNAGLVLLWPLLPRLFRTLGLVDERGFIDAHTRMQAVCCLDWLAWGDGAGAEWRAPLNRLMCAMPSEQTLLWQSPDLEKQAQLDIWLTGATAQLLSLNRCGINDLRTLFLQRPGALRKAGTHKILSVEPDTTDVLLGNLPWSLTQVTLPWLADPLLVEWI